MLCEVCRDTRPATCPGCQEYRGHVIQPHVADTVRVFRDGAYVATGPVNVAQLWIDSQCDRCPPPRVVGW